MIPHLAILLLGLDGSRQAHRAPLEPPRPPPAADTAEAELAVELWWVERGHRPWSGRSPLTRPGWPRPPPDLPPG